jgi:hypothetical protein
MYEYAPDLTGVRYFMTNRVGPPPPEPIKGGGPKEPNAPKGASFKEKIKEVEAVSEVDLDQPRKKPFFMREEDDEGASSEVSTTDGSSDDSTSSSKAPPRPSSLGSSSGDLDDLSDQAIPVPGSSRPPVGASYDQVLPLEVEEGSSYLPASSQFWDTYGTPDEPVSPSFQESGPSNERTASTEHSKKKKNSGFIPKKKSAYEEGQLEMSRAEKDRSLPRPPFFRKEAEEKEAKRVKGEDDQGIPSQLPIQAWTPEKGEEHGGKGKEKKGIDAVGNIPEPLPPAVRQAAGDIQTSSSSYISPKISPLFFQMVGSMLYIAAAKSGISTTEIVLNSKAFEKSIFFNTTITLEKYASAPDSFNVRLTGSTEAIKVFNDNMPNLIAAFANAYDKKKIRFRIGRIETSFEGERPLIRRKKEMEEKGQP